jgi:nucleotide-binding universal stress UspA family protein
MQGSKVLRHGGERPCSGDVAEDEPDVMTKIEPGSVVVGVDGSRPSDAAVLWAARYAACARRPLRIVSAIGDLRPGERLFDPTEARHERRICARRVADAALVLARRSAPELRVATLTPNGDARQALVGLSGQAAIVVVGTRGHGPVTSLLLGSVSAAVSAHAASPVAVVRPPRHHATGIVVGVSGDGSDQTAVDFAADLASMYGAPLDAVHAWRWDGASLDGVTDAQRREALTRHERTLSATLCGLAEKYPDVDVHQHLADGTAVAALVHWSETADVVVVGSRGRTSTVGLVGSVGRAVAEHAPSTVVVVRA